MFTFKIRNVNIAFFGGIPSLPQVCPNEPGKNQGRKEEMTYQSVGQSPRNGCMPAEPFQFFRITTFANSAVLVAVFLT